MTEKDSVNSRVRYMIARQDEAYKRGVTGTWTERWIPGVCKHSRIRCTHGDEIIYRKWRRRCCMVCGRVLKGPLPEICFFTGRAHNR